jgi:ATP-dependent DNA helicase RecQ
VNPREILQRTFGYPTFRGQQEAVIQHVLAGKHALVIMPTGMGKSLCFQVPALVEQQSALAGKAASESLNALTLVLSPLIALMKDQVETLVSKGIDAAFINSSLNRAERESRYRAVAEGRYTLLYVTPERFRKPDFLQVIDQRRVVLLAVDEAHCVSEWGHDFRPDYTRLDEFRQRLGNPITIALTATATPEVQADIICQLGLGPDATTLFHEGIDRPNLSLRVEPTWGEDEKLARIIVAAEHHRHRGSGIVYFTLIKDLTAVSERLTAAGIDHVCYHGDLQRSARRRVQEQFMSGAAPLVLATNAFGMGIDKADIRLVIHADVPGSLEAYYQEIGRAGRDGLPAECLLLYDEHDLTTQMQFIAGCNPSAEFYQRVYDLLTRNPEQVAAFGIEWIEQKLYGRKANDSRLETVLGMFDRYGVIDRGPHRQQCSLLGDLPPALVDQGRLNEKLERDQRKLYTLVQYARHEGDRKAFIHDYFGLPYPAS